MKTLYSFVAGFRPASLILARRVALPLLVLSAGLVVVQPCASAPFEFEETGSLNTARYLTRRRCCPTARCSSQAVGNGRQSRERGTLRSGERDLDGQRQPRHRTGWSHGDVAAQRQGARRRRLQQHRRLLASAELYDPASGTWTATGSLATARDFHTATLLRNGKVLVAGGDGLDSQSLTSAELYDPASGTWTATGSLNTARFLHTATLLPNGKVLVAGGYNDSGYLASAELYDPASGTWTATGSLATARDRHTATLLPNGKVLRRRRFQRRGSRKHGTLRSGQRDLGHQQPQHRARGSHGDIAAQRQGARRRRFQLTDLASAELYDPASGTWTATGSLTTARFIHTATLLPNGKVLVAGGFNGAARERGTLRCRPRI